MALSSRLSWLTPFPEPPKFLWEGSDSWLGNPWTSHVPILLGIALALAIVYALYVQCCAQPKKRSPSTGTVHTSPSLASIPLTRTSSRESSASDYYLPIPSTNKGDDNAPRRSSFNGLVELTKPALQHIGASLPVGTIRTAVERLNDRLQYRLVTSKTHVGGGLSSIFLAENEPPLVRTPTLSHTFEEDFFLGSDDEYLDRDVVSSQLTEQAFRRSEVFSSLPDSIIRLLIKKCQIRTLQQGEALFSAHERKTPSASMYVLISGEMSLTIPSTFFAPSIGHGLVDPEEFEESSREETITLVPGKTITGISDFIATIVGEPVEYVATATAKQLCTIAEVDYPHLEQIFDAHEGVREDLLQRYLALLQRVTYTSIYRLTGRYASSFSILANGSKLKSFSSSSDVSDDWAMITATELGLEPQDLLSFVKERKRRLSRYQLAVEETGDNESSTLGPRGSLLGMRGEFPCIAQYEDRESILSTDFAMYVVLSGALEIRTYHFAGDTKGTLQFRVGPGQGVGQLKLLTRTFAEWYHARDCVRSDEDYPYNSLVACGPTKLLKITERDYFDLIERFPEIITHLARKTVRNLAPLVRLVDITTNFFQAQPGDAIIKEGELVDGLMVVLHGRVRYMRGETSTGHEYGRGEVLGESSFLTNQPSMDSVVAMRRTSLAWVPKLIVRSVAARYPNSLAHIGRTISRKMLHSNDIIGDPKNRGVTSRVRRAVAVVPVSPNVPVDSFIRALNAALIAQGIKSTILSSGRLRPSPGDSPRMEFYGGLPSVDSPSATTLEEIEILSRMQDAEEANDVVLFNLDPWSVTEDASKWSKLCVAQADVVLLVANAADHPMPCPLERRLRLVSSSARRELVMLHVMSESGLPNFLPQNTREWIEELGGVVSSHHVRFHPYDSRLDTFFWKSDIRRLGRWVTGNAIGVVLGGGGARGSAHLSVLRALEQFQIPIDFIAGTSIGAFVGGLYCLKGGNMAEVTRMFDTFASDMSSLWNKVRDVTFPIVAYLKGYRFNRAIVRAFGAANIEDFWINFCCISTDLTDSREIAHRNGFAWKYIRASMTLTGYLPPICDVQIENGRPVVHYLVDGGYIDNMPVDEMRKIVGRTGTVIAVDVQSEWTLGGEDYGEDLNGWWYLWRWLSPFHTTPNIPTANEIQSHLAYISCVQRFGKAMSEIPVDLYLAPPLGPTLTLDFKSAEMVQEQTLQPMIDRVAAWLQDPKTREKTVLAESVALALNERGVKPEKLGSSPNDKS